MVDRGLRSWFELNRRNLRRSESRWQSESQVLQHVGPPSEEQLKCSYRLVCISRQLDSTLLLCVTQVPAHQDQMVTSLRAHASGRKEDGLLRDVSELVEK